MSLAPAKIPARTAASLLVFIVVVAAATAGYIFKKDIPPEQVAPALAAFLLLLVPFLGLGYPEVAEAFRRFGAGGIARAAILMGAVAVPPAILLLVNRGPGALLHAAAVLVYAAFPAFILRWAAARGESPNVADALAVVAIWLPVEFGLLKGAWSVGSADPSYVIAKTFCVSVILVGFVAVRPLPGLGYRWRLRLEDAGVAAVALAVFLAVAVPAALMMRFVEFAPKPVTVGGVAYRFLAIGLLIALPEEILFRGVIFNLMQRATAGRHGPIPALILSSVVFGLAHVNNFPYFYPDLDFRYAILATWAGLCYGWCYLKTGNLLGGILTHTSVDVITRLMFTVS